MNIKVIAPILLTLVLTACGGGGGGGGGNPSTPITSLKVSVTAAVDPSGIYYMQSADLNNDGLEDVVVSAWNRDDYINHVYIFIQNANGTLTDKTSTLLANSVVQGTSHILINDFNKDGHVDIFLSGYKEDNIGQVGVPSVMLWGSSTQYIRQDWDINLAAGACMSDFNNDGYMDLLVAGGGFTAQNDIGGIYLNNTNQTKFTLQANNILGDNQFSSCAAFKNGTDTVVYLGNNTFTNPPQNRILTIDSSLNVTSQTIVAVSANYYSVDAVAVDLNNDGSVDFVDIQNGNAGAVDSVGPKILYKNNNDGTFTATTLSSALSGMYSKVLSINGTPSLFVSGSVQNAHMLQGSAKINVSSFTDMAAGTSAQDVAMIYQNTSNGKIYMLELLDGTFYTQELK